MEIVALESDHAEMVQSLASHHYPSAYALPYETIVENLEKNDENSFCFGVESEGKLVGYLMAWLDTTMVEGRREKVVLVDDIVLGNRARHQLFRLLQAMIKEMRERGLRHLAIEGSARPSSGNTFMGHPEVLERLGYELTSTADYYDDDFDETLTWVRYEPLEVGQTHIDESDQLDIGFS